MRLITRTDFDGLACAVFLEEVGLVDSYKFLHPKVIQDGLLKIGPDDIIANMPYAPGCGYWFDHHTSELSRLDVKEIEFKGDCRSAPSAAQVIWDYFGGEKKFGKKYLPMLEAVNKYDSATLTREEILYPSGWILIGLLLDPRTGLGRFDNFRLGQISFTLHMIRYSRRLTSGEILKLPDVKERLERFCEQQIYFEEMIRNCSEIRKNVLVINLLEEEYIYAGNRFLPSALFPEQNIEIRIMWGPGKKNVVFACGHSIVNRSSRTNVGQLMLSYGGGGHLRVGSCQIPAENREKVLEELVEKMQHDG
ncbi:MAG: exopolyphosphatase [Desulfococcaceae bacterium]|jgi:nanoRNase/pAp phosphatase (c-di-AMP/oligoRNAs hydrolase)|nr:exopolyphosphatase [Desulfococcaceae bacterium]